MTTYSMLCAVPIQIRFTKPVTCGMDVTKISRRKTNLLEVHFAFHNHARKETTKMKIQPVREIVTKDPQEDDSAVLPGLRNLC